MPHAHAHAHATCHTCPRALIDRAAPHSVLSSCARLCSVTILTHTWLPAGASGSNSTFCPTTCNLTSPLLIHEFLACYTGGQQHISGTLPSNALVFGNTHRSCSVHQGERQAFRSELVGARQRVASAPYGSSLLLSSFARPSSLVARPYHAHGAHLSARQQTACRLCSSAHLHSTARLPPMSPGVGTRSSPFLHR